MAIDFQSWPQWKRLSVIWTGLAGIVSATVIIFNAVGVAEPYWAAHRDFVREEVKTATTTINASFKQLEVRQIDTQVQIARSTRRAIETDIATKETLLKQNAANIPPEVRLSIEAQLRDLRVELEETRNAIEDLRGQKIRPR